MYILITGSRNASGGLLMEVQKYIQSNPDNTYILGDAQGVDNIARRTCEVNRIPFICHGAFKKMRYGSYMPKNNVALDMDYLARDRYMVDHYPLELCVGFWDGVSRGTRYTMRYAFDHGVKVLLYRDGVPPIEYS